MRIDFECTGGFANLRLAYKVRTDELPQKQAKEIVNLIDASGYFELRPDDLASGANGPPDVFHYKVSISDGERKKAVSCNDVSAPTNLHPLLAKFRELAMDQGRKG
jgi:hypothetical protein